MTEKKKITFGEWKESEAMKLAKRKYMAKMEAAYKGKHYAKAIAELLDVEPENVEDSAPVKKWNWAFDTPDKRKAKADKWMLNFAAAYLPPAEEK